MVSARVGEGAGVAATALDGVQAGAGVAATVSAGVGLNIGA